VNTAVATAAPAPARFGNLRHTALSAFWFGNFFMWQPLTTIVIQNQIDQVVPKANQGTAIGIAVSVGGRAGEEELIAKADAALYVAKHQGKSTFHLGSG